MTKNTRAIHAVKDHKPIIIVVFILSFLVALKTIFVSFNVDEEYQITMGYRLIRGDRLFVDIWDPHQTSAFLTEALMWVFHAIFRTYTRVVIWLRIWGNLIHLLAAYSIYRVIKDYLDPEYAFYLAALYFNLLPKNSILPDFSIMFVWSLTFLLVSLCYLLRDEKIIYAFIAGIWMCLAVLSYPSALLIFPVVLLVFVLFSKHRTKDIVVFSATSAVGGGIYLLYVLSITGSLSAFLGLIHDMLQGQGSHSDLTAAYKLSHYAKEFFVALLLCCGYLLVSKAILFVVGRIRQKKVEQVHVLVFAIVIGELHHILHWLLDLTTYEGVYNYSLYFLILSAALYYVRKTDESFGKIAIIWILLCFVELICVLILTDLTVFTSVKYMTPAVVIGLGVIVKYADADVSKTDSFVSRLLLVIVCMTAIFVKGWQCPVSGGYLSNITDVGGIIKQGPGTGVFTEYMNSYIARCTGEEMEQLVPDGTSLLVVDNSSIPYMYRDVTVSSYTTICYPSYNEVLLKYWDNHPEKYPDVIAVTCWYGELKWDPDSWIMKWIENDYNAEKVIEGKYYRYYFRSKDEAPEYRETDSQ